MISSHNFTKFNPRKEKVRTDNRRKVNVFYDDDSNIGLAEWDCTCCQFNFKNPETKLAVLVILVKRVPLFSRFADFNHILFLKQILKSPK